MSSGAMWRRSAGSRCLSALSSPKRSRLWPADSALLCAALATRSGASGGKTGGIDPVRDGGVARTGEVAGLRLPFAPCAGVISQCLPRALGGALLLAVAPCLG